MNILLWIIFGAIAGWVASLVMKSSQGIFMDIFVGIFAAFVGGFIFNLFGSTGVTGFNIYSLLVTIVGAIALLWLAKALRRA